MIKILTTNVVKGRFVGEDGKLSPRKYTFFVNMDVLIGDVLEVFTRGKNSDVVVTDINVDPAEIEPYKDVTKTLTPRPREIKPLQEDADNE